MSVKSLRTGDGPRPKKGGADSHDGCAFFDGDPEVTGHAHGKLPQLREAGFLEAVAQLAQPPEVRAGCFGVFGLRGHRHQSSQLQPFERGDDRDEPG